MQMMWMAIYLTCMLIEVFILCWFGDELIWKVLYCLRDLTERQWWLKMWAGIRYSCEILALISGRIVYKTIFFN